MRRLVTCVIAVALLGLAPGNAAGAAPQQAQGNDPHFHEPAVGECRDLTLDQAVNRVDRTAPIDCGERHTTRVIAVRQLPDGMDWDTPRDQMARPVEQACFPAWEEALGRTNRIRHQTAYIRFWFIPTRRERRHGARWVRCDIALVRAPKLAPLRVDTAPMIPDGPVSDKIARCLKERTLYLTTCSRPHVFRATGTFQVRRDDYPTREVLDRIAERRCRDHVTTPGYYWRWPPEWTWLAGDHTVTCYSATTE